ncbi:hypothetical protein BCV69DRAFT_297606 [Microstroma glucosiphilum]|uniref:BRCT domain-containing protein n=1 Tax=Pseudomicrostroma glucosiphilum TaxID=1684307 RepID=A0A316UAX8_9BASI|nr:hypothetical protein BCV69DRAFT_297606 [Pseudomicrostroma glucosiphilum]PWN22312.1 hypothetical protein BCV69DRAFT_297606 [Pseudomicrostroma glucosiphilum]
MSLVELPTTRTRARRVQGVGLPTQQQRRRSPTKHHRADVEPRRASLEQGDGISQFTPADGQDKLREALRRSASAVSPPHASDSGSSRAAANRFQAAVSPVRSRRRLAATEDTDCAKAINVSDSLSKGESERGSHGSDIDTPSFCGPSKNPILARRVTAASNKAAAGVNQASLTLPISFTESAEKATSSSVGSSSQKLEKSSSPVTSSSPARRPPMATRTSDERLAEIRARLTKATENAAGERQRRDLADADVVRRRTRRTLLDQEENATHDEPSPRGHSEERSRVGGTSSSARRVLVAASASPRVSLGRNEPIEASQTPPRTRRSDREADTIDQELDGSPRQSTTLRSRTRPALSRVSSDESHSSDTSDQHLQVKRPSLQHRKSSEDGTRRPFSTVNALDTASPRRRRNEKEVDDEQTDQSSPRRGANNVSPALASLEASLARLGARRTNQQSGQDEPVTRDRSTPSRRERLSDTTQHLTVATPDESPKLRTSIGRHQDRLLDSEKGADQAGNSPRKEVPSTLPLVSPSSKPGMTFLERARAARARAQTSAAETLAKQEAEEAAARAREKQEAEQAEIEKVREEEAEQRRLQALKKISRRRTLQAIRDAPPGQASEDEEDEARVEREVTPMSERESSPELGDNSEALARVARAERSALRLQRGRSMHSPAPPHRSLEAAEKSREPSEGISGRTDDHRTAITDAASLRRRVSAGGARVSSISRMDSINRMESLAAPSEGMLKGVVVLVDIRDRDGNDMSSPCGKLLKAHGAKVASRIPSAESRRTLTHIVWKNGTPSTLRYFNGLDAGKKPLIVMPSWVDGCLQEDRKIAEEPYLAEVGKSTLWQQRRGPADKKEVTHRPTIIAGDSSLLEKSIKDALQAILAHAPLEPSPLRTALYLDL